MSQINEGDLQAYLDGAYEVLTPEQIAEIERLVAEDEAFAAQVDEARAVRSEASRILGDAVPQEFAPPPFEELQRRAAAADAPVPSTEKPEKRRWIGVPPLVGMGWAATVVLALGVGWFVGQGAGDVQFGNFRALESQSASPQAEAESPFEADLQGREMPPAVVESAEDADASNEVARGGADAPADLVGRTFSDADGEDTEKSKVDEGAASGFAEGAQSGPPASLDEVARSEAAPPAAPAETGTREAQEVAGEEAAVRQPEARRANEAEEFARARGDLAQAEQNAGAAPSRDARLQSGSEEHAYHSLALPGLEVLSVTLDEAGALSGLMILHQLPAGDTLELRYVGLFSEAYDPPGAGGLADRAEMESLPALSAQLREAALPPGWRQVVVRKENRWVVARAPISEAQIRAYLMTLN
ncbi:MAG: hypothetical protein ACR2QM_00990 [Longimicrobiales bacterium]